MNVYYLMVKTHRKTGLKYLCQTVSKDPFKYLGSGTYWKAHRKVHGDDIHTEVISICYSKEELRENGIFYSELWDVVNAVDESGRKTWANLRPEEGDGGWGGEQNPNNLPGAKERQRLAVTGNKNPVKKNGVKQKIKKSTQTSMWVPEIRKKHLDGIHSESWLKARRGRIGSKAPCYDSTIYVFEHKDGRVEKMTQYDFCSTYGISRAFVNMVVLGRTKTCFGWRVVR